MARIYKVQSDDTLSGIAQRFYGDSTLFGLIATVNNLANPDVIVPGQILRIPQLPEHWDVVQGFQKFDLGLLIGPSTNTMPVKVAVTVPAGMRLVIDNVSGLVEAVKGVTVSPVLLRSNPSASEIPRQFTFPWTPVSVPDPVFPTSYGYNFATKMYLDGPINSVEFLLNARPAQETEGGTGFLSLTGYLEALPPAPPA